MPHVPHFHHFGGTHWETAALKNALAHSGVVAPHTGKPLSEAMCLGLAGGIAAGYSFCPSIPGWQAKLEADPKLAAKLMKDAQARAGAKGGGGGATLEACYIKQFNCGSGVSIVGRHHAFSTGADKYDAPLKRLGFKTTVKETTSVKAAQQHLVDALAAGRPAFLWTAALKVTSLGWAGTCGVYSTLCVGIDDAKGIALLADRGPDAVEVSLEELSFLRNRVCSFKNRSLTFEAGKLDEKTLKAGVLDALRACAADFAMPKLGTYNLPGLLELSKVIANPKNKKGWPAVYGLPSRTKQGTGGSGGTRLFLPMRDVFESIETAGTGGGLLRPMYADFLDEAAQVAGKPALKRVAASYRKVAGEWTQLAEACLPDAIKPFKKTKELLRKRENLLKQKGTKAAKELEKQTTELNDLAGEIRQAFPMDDAEALEHLKSLSRRIAALHAAETEAAKELHAAIGAAASTR